jgi:hypothetical protein
VKIFVAEPDADIVDQLWNDAGDVFCLDVGYVEIRAAIARRLDRRAARRARSLLDEYWGSVETSSTDDRLLARALQVVDAHQLRALDALHLAAALDHGASGLTFATWDVEQRRAAAAEGIVVAP